MKELRQTINICLFYEFSCAAIFTMRIKWSHSNRQESKITTIDNLLSTLRYRFWGTKTALRDNYKRPTAMCEIGMLVVWSSHHAFAWVGILFSPVLIEGVQLQCALEILRTKTIVIVILHQIRHTSYPTNWSNFSWKQFNRKQGKRPQHSPHSFT